MKCPKCHTENPEKKKFCHECGAKLLMVCLHCGAEIIPGDRFCGECGEKLDEAAEQSQKPASEAEGERKHVTALFSDLSGYTAMSERLDPEEVKEIMSRIFGEIAQVVTKYEGFIEKFIGDAVMASFIRNEFALLAIIEALKHFKQYNDNRHIDEHVHIKTGIH